LPLEGRKQDKMSGVADKFFLTAKELTVMGIAAVAVIICFALAASFLDNMNNAYAQQEQQGSTSVEGLLGTINSSVIAISGLIATAMSIVTGVVAWLRAKFGEKVISDDTNDWLQDLI
jgi:amino acid permease